MLDGLRFHMHGSWELNVEIDAAQGRDSVLIDLEL